MTKSVRLIYFSQFYSPESIAGSFRAAENASLWTKSGNQVHVFTGYPNYPTGKVFEGYNVKNLSIDIVDGIKVFRSKLSAVPNTSTINRLKNALSYYLYGRINTIFRDKNIWDSYDAVIGSSGPIFNALLAEKYAQKHKIPFIFDIRDINYVQMQATGRSANTLSVRIMRALELHLCKKAAKVVVVTNGFKEKLITEGISETRIDVITNGVDVLPTPKSNIEGELVLSYFGTLGISQNISGTFEYSDYIHELIPTTKYLIIGEGAEKDRIVNLIAEKQYIEMKPGMSQEKLEPYYGTTSLSVIKLKNASQFRYTIPSKLFQIMGRGIAVLYIGPEAECSSIINQNKAGICLTGTSEENKSILKQFFSSNKWEQELETMGKNGRRAVEKDYTRTELANKYLEILKRTIQTCK